MATWEDGRWYAAAVEPFRRFQEAYWRLRKLISTKSIPPEKGPIRWRSTARRYAEANGLSMQECIEVD